MDDVTFVDVENYDGVVTTHAIIDHEEGSFTSMPKAVWDERQKTAELGGTL